MFPDLGGVFRHYRGYSQPSHDIRDGHLHFDFSVQIDKSDVSRKAGHGVKLQKSARYACISTLDYRVIRDVHSRILTAQASSSACKPSCRPKDMEDQNARASLVASKAWKTHVHEKLVHAPNERSCNLQIVITSYLPQ
jgi:hypothetical protein